MSAVRSHAGARPSKHWRDRRVFQFSNNEKDYNKLARAVIEMIKPTDTLELLFTNDVIHFLFDIRRLRRIKIGLIECNCIFGTPSEEQAACQPEEEDRVEEGDDGFEEEESEKTRKAGEFRWFTGRDADSFMRCSSEWEAA
jgi:hypothetical protein